MQAKPVTFMLKNAGGVDPTSPLAGELRHMGISPTAAPGLFKTGGIGAVDNFPVADHPIFALHGDGLYIKPEAILEALRDETFGKPWRTDQQAQTEREKQAEVDAADIDAVIHSTLTAIGMTHDSWAPEQMAEITRRVGAGEDAIDAMEGMAQQIAEEPLSDDDKGLLQIEDNSGISFYDEADDEVHRPTAPEARPSGEASGQEVGRPGGAVEPEQGASGPRAGGTEPGADGKPQLTIPGTEPESAAQTGQRGADAPLKPKADQKLGMDMGLFGEKAEQTDIEAAEPDLIRQLRKQGGATEDQIRQATEELAAGDDSLVKDLLRIHKPKPAAANPQITLARQLVSVLSDTDKPITAQRLIVEAETAYGGTMAAGRFTRHDMHEALELAVNLRVRDDVSLRAVYAGWQGPSQKLDKLVSRLPAQRVRSEEQQSFQQFSTPPHYAMAAAYVANPRSGDIVMEPSAGTGSLVAAAVRPGVTFIANELDPTRAAMLREVVGDRGRVFTENAEQIDNVLPADVKPTLVVMNPPFSQTAGRMGDRKDIMAGAKHIEQALKRLEPGGRLVAIVGRGMTMDAPTFKAWWTKIGRDHAVRANIGVDGSVYAKYGTTFGTRLIVIDKVASGSPPVIAEVQTVEDLMRLLEPVKDARAKAPAAEQDAPEPGRPGVPDQGESAPRPDDAARPGAGVVGPGARRPGGLPEQVPVRGGAAGSSDAGLAAEGRPGVAGQQPGRPGEAGAGVDAGGRPATQDSEPKGGRGDRPEHDLQPDAKPTAGPSGVEFENAAPGSQAASSAITDSLYETYQPQRVRVKGAKPHPGPLVQSAAMASVEPPPPTYTPNLPVKIINDGMLSLAQLEAVIYTGQAHEKMLPAAKEGETAKRRGHFIGDGTGVGKGREIAGIMLDNWRQGRTKAVWVSEKQPLMQDAKRDWSGIGQDPNIIFDFGKTKTGTPIKLAKGIAFTTYDTLKGGMSDQAAIARGGFIRGEKVKFIIAPGSPYTGKIGTITGKAITRDKKTYYPIKFDDGTRFEEEATRIERVGDAISTKSRVDQIVDWLGADFDGVIAFDEAHNMGNSEAVKGARGMKDASMKALAGIALQDRLPNARVVYVSATGATEVSNLAYADRLGLWGRGTPFAGRRDFIGAIEGGGIAAMELVARDMKQLGLYTARNLSYDGVEYERVDHILNPGQREIYDTLAEAWQSVLKNFNAALEETGGKENAKAKSAAMSAFWGAHQRFFNQIITSMQMPSVIKAVELDLKEGRQAVLQLTNTSEAAQNRAAAKATTAEEIEDLDITPRDGLIQLIEKSFPTQQYESFIDENGNEGTRPVLDAAGNPVENREAVRMRDELIDRVASVRVPQGPLDMVLDHFGIDTVAEVTGRKRRFVMKPDPDTGAMRRVEDSRPGSSNLTEADAFQSSKKRILVFSQAGGTGRSYHADNQSKSKDARRVHYLVQAGWRADTAVQGFGRTHRTNQASAPIFRLVTTDLKGQKRFISSIARRLAQLGALTKGQRQAGDQGVFSARDNLESQEAKDALQEFYQDLIAGAIDGITVEKFEAQTGLMLRQIDKSGAVLSIKQDLPPIQQFLNRLLSLNIDLQNLVFDAFSERIDAVIEARQQAGMLDLGLETVRADKIEKVSEQTVHTIEEVGAETKYLKLKLSNRFKPRRFKAVGHGERVEKWVKSPKGHVYAAIQALSKTDANTGHIIDQYHILSPVSETRLIARDNINRRDSKWEEVDAVAAKALWEAETAEAPEFVTSDLHLITGAILPIWDRLGGSPRVIRLQTDKDERLIGRVISTSQITKTLKALGADIESAKVDIADVFPRLMAGGRAKLANDWTLKRSLVAGEHRIELTGPSSFAEGEQVKADGVFTERIEYSTRYFVPTDPVKGPKVLEALTKFRPVVELDEAGPRQARLESRDADEPVFYSALLRAVEGMQQPKGTAQQWAAMIQKAPGVKREEMEWTGVLEWLGEQKGPVTREQVTGFIRANQIEVKEVEKGDGDTSDVEAWWTDEGGANEETPYNELTPAEQQVAIERYRDEVGQYEDGATRHSGWQLPGGKNYRELLLTLPAEEPTLTIGPFEPFAGVGAAMWEGRHRVEGVREARFSILSEEGRITYWPKTFNWNGVEQPGKYVVNSTNLQNARFDTAAAATAYIRESATPGGYVGKNRRDTFRTSHYDEPNILAHVRFNEREADGKRVLFIEEIQSDWHQKGRKQGYAGKSRSIEAIDRDIDANHEEMVRREPQLGQGSPTLQDWDAAWEKHPQLYELDRTLYRERGIAQEGGVPDAPFKTTWPELAFKRMLRYAVDNGFDRVAWTPGDVQADRYDLSKQIDSISYSPPDDNFPGGNLVAFKDGRKAIDRGVMPADLPDLIGKEAADKLLSAPLQSNGGRPFHHLANQDLRVGGEGMRGFYDAILPATVNKLVKRWGGRVTRSEIAVGRKSGASAPVGVVQTEDGLWRIQWSNSSGLSARGWKDKSEADAFLASKMDQLPVHSLDITDAMRGEVRKGLPLFNLHGAIVKALDKRPELRGEIEAYAHRILGHGLVKVQFADTIDGSTTIGGRYDPNIEVVEIAMKVGDPKRAMRHEVIHPMRQRGLITKPEWAVLRRRALAEWMDQYNIRARYAHYLDEIKGEAIAEEMLIEEAVADAWSHWRKNPEAETLTGRIFAKIERFIEAVRNLLRGHLPAGTVEDIFAGFEAGVAAKRPRQMRGGRGFDVLSRLEQRNEPPGLFAAGIRRPATAWEARAARFRGRVQSATDPARVYIQDRFLAIKRMQESIEAEVGTKFTTTIDAYQAIRLYIGRAGERLVDLQKKHVEPLIEDMRAKGIDAEKLDRFLYARHAPERNARMKEINPDIGDAGSGMTDAAAEAIIAEITAAGRLDDYAALATRVDRIIAGSRKTLVAAGLIDEETELLWRTTYPNYVPLRGFDDVAMRADEHGVGSTRPRTGRGFDVRGPESKRALGRRSKADSPLAYVVQQAEQAIVRAEKNAVLKTVLRFAQEARKTNPKLFKIDKAEMKRRANPETGLVETYAVPPQFSKAENLFAVKIGGKTHYIEVNHPGFARALRGVGSSIDNVVASALLRFSHWYSAMLTQWNPEFVPVNAVRDLQTALVNVSEFDNLAKGARRAILKDAFSLKSIRGALAAMYDRKSTNEMKNWYNEYRLAGGKVSFIEMNDIDRIKRRIDKSVTAGDLRRGLGHLGDLVGNLNTAVENGVRLSVYANLRKHDVDKAKAALIARDLTTDFNLRGEWSAVLNAMYIFFNASLQGSVRLARAVARSKTARVAVAGIFSFGFAIDFINALLSGDDDEEPYDEIPDYERENNLIVMLPGGNHIKFPLAYGYNAPFVAGQQLASVLRGARKPSEAALTTGSAMMSSFNPLGSFGSVAQFMAPWFVDPFVQSGENKKFHGGPIMPKVYDEAKPLSETYFNSAPEWAKSLARVLNESTGGTVGRPGYIDISPETLEHYAEFAGGGVGRFLVNSFNTAERMASSEEWLPEMTPLLRRFYVRADTGAAMERRYFDAWAEVDQAHHEQLTLRKAGEIEKAQAAAERYRPELRAHDAFKAAQKVRKEVRTQRIKAGKISDKAKRQKIEQNLDAAEKRALEAALEVYRKAQAAE